MTEGQRSYVKANSPPGRKPPFIDKNGAGGCGPPKGEKGRAYSGHDFLVPFQKNRDVPKGGIGEEKPPSTAYSGLVVLTPEGGMFRGEPPS